MTDPLFWTALPSTLFGLSCVLASVGWIILVVRADLDEEGDKSDGVEYEDLS